MRKIFYSIVYRLNYLGPVITALATAAIVWVAYWQLDISKQTDRTLRDTLVASNRGWIAPKSLKKPQEIKVGADALFYFTFGNPGKSPAVKAGRHEDFRTIATAGLGPPVRAVTDITNKPFALFCRILLSLRVESHLLGQH